MPPNVHTALRTAADAAATLRAQLSDLATAVENDDNEAIVRSARSLVSGDTEPWRKNPDRPRNKLSAERGESSS